MPLWVNYTRRGSLVLPASDRGQLLALLPCMLLQTGHRCGNQQAEPPPWETRCQSWAVGPPFGYIALDEMLLFLSCPAPGVVTASHTGFCMRVFCSYRAFPYCLLHGSHSCDLPLASPCRRRKVLPCPCCTYGTLGAESTLQSRMRMGEDQAAGILATLLVIHVSQ